jgi:hypothetical protein
MSGRASFGSDYTLSGAAGQVTIAAGQSSATITLSAIKDKVREKAEPATMTLQAGSGYALKMTGTGRKAKPPSATVSIFD